METQDNLKLFKKQKVGTVAGRSVVGAAAPAVAEYQQRACNISR